MPGEYFGIYTGIVKDNHDGEKLGQLQVSVPTIFPPEEAVTARAALPYGGFFVPEIGGEWAPEADADPPQKRVIRTPSGHVILLNDRGGEEGIEIRSNARIILRCLGTIEIQAPNVIINGRTVAPQPRPI